MTIYRWGRGGATMEASYGLRDLFAASSSRTGWSKLGYALTSHHEMAGTNDFCCGRDENRTFVREYEEAYFHFVHDQIVVKYKSPDLPIFLGAGPMTLSYASSVKRVLIRLEAAGVNAHYLDLDVGNEAPTGCSGHPSAATHLRMAALAQGQIAEVLEWDL